MREPLDSTETLEPAMREPTALRPARVAKAVPGTAPRSSGYAPKHSRVPQTAERQVEPEDEDESFFQRNRVAIVIGVLALVGGGWFFFGKSGEKSAPPRKAPEPQIVRLVMPPPPAPPPPPPKIQPPPPKDEKANRPQSINPWTNPSKSPRKNHRSRLAPRSKVVRLWLDLARN